MNGFSSVLSVLSFILSLVAAIYAARTATRQQELQDRHDAEDEVDDEEPDITSKAFQLNAGVHVVYRKYDSNGRYVLKSFTGVIVDTLGRHRHFVNGKPIQAAEQNPTVPRLGDKHYLEDLTPAQRRRLQSRKPNIHWGRNFILYGQPPRKRHHASSIN